jgi:hypothetical protein
MKLREHLEIAVTPEREIVEWIANAWRRWRSRRSVVGAVGIEPTTSCVSSRRSPAELSTPGMDMTAADADNPTKTGA